VTGGKGRTVTFTLLIPKTLLLLMLLVVYVCLRILFISRPNVARFEISLSQSCSLILAFVTESFKFKDKLMQFK